MRFPVSAAALSSLSRRNTPASLTLSSLHRPRASLLPASFSSGRHQGQRRDFSAGTEEVIFYTCLSLSLVNAVYQWKKAYDSYAASKARRKEELASLQRDNERLQFEARQKKSDIEGLQARIKNLEEQLKQLNHL